MFIKRLPYICQQMKRRDYEVPSKESVHSAKPKIPSVFVLQMAQGDFTLVSKYKFQKNQYILHHTCTTNTCNTKSCDHFSNVTKSNLFYDICSGTEFSPSQLSCFIKFSKDPNCFLVKKFVNKELNLGLYALRDIREGEELSISKNFDNLLEIFNEFSPSFPKELNLSNLKFLRKLYLEKLTEKLNVSDLDIFNVNSLEVSQRERSYLNNLPNLVSITQSIEQTILSHFSPPNSSPSKFLYSLKNKNKPTLTSLTKLTLKLFNLTDDYYDKIYLILSIEHSTITLSQKLSMLLNTYRLFLLWINCEHTFTYVSRLERFIICYIISFNSLMESWISINDWVKLLVDVKVLKTEKNVNDVKCDNEKNGGYENEKTRYAFDMECEEITERFKWLQFRCLECVEYKSMITLCSYHKFLVEICDRFK